MNNERNITEQDFREAEAYNLEQARIAYRERATKASKAAFDRQEQSRLATNPNSLSSETGDVSYDLPANFFMDLDISSDSSAPIDEFESQSSNYSEEDSTGEDAPLGEKLRVASETMQHLVNENWLASAREYAELKDTETALKLMKRQQIDLMSRTKDDNLKNGLRRAIFQLDKSLENNTTRQAALVEIPDSSDSEDDSHHGSPESWAWVHSKEYLDHVQESHDRRLITTPYVREKLDQIISSIQNGEHIYVHGHTGGGKTELANMAAIEYKVSDEAYLAAMEDVKNSPDIQSAAKSERVKMLVKSYNFHHDRLMKALENNDPMARETLTPLHIAGSGNMTEQDLYVDKEIQLDTKDGTTGVVTKSIKKELYQAIESGRPIIIDEANAIPANVLLSMNDILTKKPGQTVFIPGAKEPVEVKRGFTVIFTGNESTAFTDYSGTAPLNPAVANRFKSISYGYLPMSESDQYYNKQEDPAKNELFQVMVTHLADKRGNLTLRDMDNSLQKIFTFSQFVHFSQRFFAGDTDEGDYTMSAGDERELRAEGDSVLSIRNALAILDSWANNKSDRSPATLDEAIWKGFIDGLTNDNDKNTLVKIAHERFGFFSSNEGWNIGKDKNGNPKDYSPGQPGITLEEAHPGPFKSEVKELEYMPRFDVLSVLYGPRPNREFYPDEIDLEDVKSEQEFLEDRYNQLVDEKFDLELEVLPILNYANTKFPDPSLSKSIAIANAFIKKFDAIDSYSKSTSAKARNLYRQINSGIPDNLLLSNFNAISQAFPGLFEWRALYTEDAGFRDSRGGIQPATTANDGWGDGFLIGGNGVIQHRFDSDITGEIKVEYLNSPFSITKIASNYLNNDFLVTDGANLLEIKAGMNYEESKNGELRKIVLPEYALALGKGDKLTAISYTDQGRAVVGTYKGKIIFLKEDQDGNLSYDTLLHTAGYENNIRAIQCRYNEIFAGDYRSGIHIIDMNSKEETQTIKLDEKIYGPINAIMPLRNGDLIVAARNMIAVVPRSEVGSYSSDPIPVEGVAVPEGNYWVEFRSLMEPYDISRKNHFIAASDDGIVCEFQKNDDGVYRVVHQEKYVNSFDNKVGITRNGDVHSFAADGSETTIRKANSIDDIKQAIPQMLAIINAEGANNE